MSNGLKVIEIPVWSQIHCRNAYSDEVVTDSMMCAGDPEEKKSVCHGDIGGPMLIKIPPWNRWHVIGIASWNEMCGLTLKPVVLTRVNHYLEWIYENFQMPTTTEESVTTTMKSTSESCYIKGQELNHGQTTISEDLEERVCDRGEMKLKKCQVFSIL